MCLYGRCSGWWTSRGSASARSPRCSRFPRGPSPRGCIARGGNSELCGRRQSTVRSNRVQDNASNADSTMPCGSARRCLWPESGPWAVTPELRAAQAHLLACRACQQFLRDMRYMAEQLRALAPSPPAPAAVRARVARTLAQARVPDALPSTPPRRRRWWGVAVAVCALGLGVGGWWAHHRPSESSGQSSLRAVAEDHIRALHEDRILTSDPATVARWMGQRVAFAIHVPVLPGAILTGGRLCLLHEQRGMVLWYRVDD